jgi:putative nucleotidyltransferase with HDIG domain
MWRKNSVRTWCFSIEGRSALYACALAITTAGVAGAGAYFALGLGDPIVVASFLIVAAIAERGSVRLSVRVEQSISVLPTLFAAILFGPEAALLVGAGSMLGDLRRPYLRVIAYSASRGLTGFVAGGLAQAAMRLPASAFVATIIATLSAAVVAEGLDLLFVSIAMRIRKIRPERSILRTVPPVLGLSVALYSPIVAFLAYAYREVSGWTMPLFLVPALAAQRLFAMYQDQRELAEDLASVNRRLESANLSFATALVATLDARDRYTAGHSAAVAIYARDIARRMGLSLEQQRSAHLAGLVHDVGKVGLPAGLLEKPGALSLEERRQMESHSAIGERILRNVDDYAEIAEIVRHHHERVDGNGYPDRLYGDEIPLVARIIAVADAYNAMTSDRPYRDAMPSRVARLRMAQAVESQFDTSVVAAFEAILAGASEDYRMAADPEFEIVHSALNRRGADTDVPELVEELRVVAGRAAVAAAVS